MLERAAGLLLHLTSLPGRFGVGDLGPEAVRFLDWLRAAGQSVWQVLPLAPPGLGDSPYSGLSTFAGHPLLISPELLRRQGLLTAADLEGAPAFRPGRVDFRRAAACKDALLRRSFERFERRPPAALRDELEGFAAARAWLEDWALYAALRAESGGRPWWRWERALRGREPGALAAARARLAPEIAYRRYLQLLFHVQWRRLRRQAHERGVRILGDLPIYVARDSAEAWARRELFELDGDGRPDAVAGVPPDYFSPTGQLWGNPLYRWQRLAEDGYAWWVERVAASLERVDLLRLDHFRAFAAYWRVPADAATAEAGEWVAGPGEALFDALRAELGELPLVAEDLGVITPDVEALRDRLGLPGMKVLHFAFDEDDSPHLPHRHRPDSVVYTATHDNDTTAGWYRRLGADARRRLDVYAGRGRGGVPWTLLRLAHASVAALAMAPVQDVLGLGSGARMNVPGRARGNWAWRLRADQLTPELAERLAALSRFSGRTGRG